MNDACCQGHLPYANNSIYQEGTSSSHKLEEILERVKKGQSEIVQIKDNIYYAITGAIFCWIRFDERTALPSLPEKFNLEKLEMLNTNPFVLSVTVPSYYLDNGEIKKKSVENSARELMEIHENLKTWAYSLPPLSMNPEDDNLNNPQKRF